MDIAMHGFDVVLYPPCRLADRKRPAPVIARINSQRLAVKIPNGRSGVAKLMRAPARAP